MKNNDFIEIYDNSASQEVCDGLIEWFDLCSAKNFTMHNMPFADGKSSSILRSDEAINTPSGIHPSNYPVSNTSLPGDICDAFWVTLNTCFKDYIEKYDLSDWRLSCYTFKLHKIKESQGFHVWHCETGNTRESQTRVLAWMTYLRIPEEGGETEFLHQSKRIEPVVGRTLIWPAYFTHMHRGNPPLKGEKYYITGWFERD